MKLFLASFVLLGLVLGCAKNPDPVVNKQLASVQVLQRLDEFQDVVIDLYRHNELSADHALLYSKFILSSTKTVHEVPDGWLPTVKQGWAELKMVVPLQQMEPKVQITAKLIDILLAGL